MDIRSQNTPAAPAAPTTPAPAPPLHEMSEPGFEVRPNDIPTDQLNTIYRGSMQEVLSQNTGLFVMIQFFANPPDEGIEIKKQSGPSQRKQHPAVLLQGTKAS